MCTKPLTFFLALLCYLLSGSIEAQTIRYIRAAPFGGGNGSSWFNASSDLQAMINASAAGDWVYVAAGTYQPISPNFYFTMKEGVKIYGGFASTNPEFSGRNWTTNVTTLTCPTGIFYTVVRNSFNGLSNAALLDGFKISGGFASQGGGMYNEFASPTIANCTFTGNNATGGGRGGGMYNINCGPVITNCRFEANKATNGGAMYNDMNSQPAISGSIFMKDTATTNGGAIFNISSMPSISNCNFQENQANSGGAFANVGANPVIANCEFRLNRSSTSGGGLYNDHSGTYVKNCRFVNGFAPLGGALYSLNGDNTTIASCIMEYNHAQNNGGAIYAAASTPVIAGCTFYNNAAQFGAVIFSDLNGSPVISNCIIWGNTAPIIDNSSSPTVQYSIVEGGYGGTGNLNADPLYINPGIDYRLQNCSPAYNAGNYTLVPAGNNADMAGNARINGATVDMGAYESNTIKAGAGNILYVNQNASGDGSSWGFPVTGLSEALRFAKGVVSQYTAANPLKIFVAKGTYKPSFHTNNACVSDRDNNFLISNNVLVYGGFDPANGVDDLNDTRITGAGGSILSGDIGAINDNTDNCFHVVTLSGTVDTARLDGFTITGGNASGPGDNYFGGGIFNNGTPAAIANCIVTGNNGHFGAGLFNGNAKPAISNCTFSGNIAVSFGGGVYNNSNSPSYTNCSFSGNSAVAVTGGGGGIFNNTATPVITNCTFTSNTGYYGGGIYNYDACAPVLSGCTFTSNAASSGGGAIYSSNSTIVNITRCTFWMNTAIFGGGALFNGGLVNGLNCYFSGNVANSYGGAVYNNGQSPNYTNCTFFGNVAVNPGGGGGGMFNSTSSPVLLNCTFNGNFGDRGGAVLNFPSSSFNMFNSIIWGNNSNNTPGIFNDPGAFSSVHYCDIQGGYTGTGNLNTDPLFVNTSLGAGADGLWGTMDDGLRLKPCSPVANMGNSSTLPAAVITDASAIPRIQFSSVDMGAYESNSLADVAAANIVGGNSVSSAWQLPNARTFYGVNCNTLAVSITGDGTATSLQGNTTVKVWVESSQPADIVKRHYEITPQDVNPATATATITLYFTQAEFDAFNAANIVKLPAGPADATGKANLLIEKRSGISGDNSGLPFSYTGKAITINPDDANIIWNAATSRWEVSFPVTGFSGFFVKTKAFTLPLRLVSFTATEKNCMVALQWVTTDEKNVSRFEAEQSADGINFSSFQTVPAKNTADENKYAVTVPVANKTMYYRLKMVDPDGRFSYSPVGTIISNCINKVMVYPNPATNKIFVRNANAGNPYTVYDNTGKMVRAGRISSTIQEVSLTGLVPGLYYIIINGDKLRFVLSAQ